LPDGKAARMIVTHDVDPATPEGISHIDAMRHSAQEAVKGTIGTTIALPAVG
jgi:putative drug exporter of the RND superfamily